MWDILKVYVPITLLVIAGFVVAWQFASPAPPHTITIATGAPDGAYSGYAERYKAILAKSGITLKVRHTAGTAENIRLLRDPRSGVDVAFVQGGIGDPSRAPNLMSLASVFLEPVWVLVRTDRTPRRLAVLKGKRIAIGAPGSGTQILARTLLVASGIDGKNATFRAIGGDAAVKALRDGSVDAAFFVSARISADLDSLIHDPAFKILDFSRAEAFKRHYLYLSKVDIPEGALALDTDLPRHDLTLVAPTAALVARTDLHPALVDLLLAAAIKVHQPGSLFSPAGAFPSPEHVNFPLSDDARRYFKSGPTFLRRVLPFWAAVMVERLLIMLVPLITLLIPLFKIAPPAYRWGIRRKIYRWYRELREIETAFNADHAARNRLTARLDHMQDQVGRVNVPLSYAEDLYHLRLHIAFVKQLVS